MTKLAPPLDFPPDLRYTYSKRPCAIHHERQVSPLSNRYEIDMCNGPLAGKLLRFTIPLMLSGILQLLFNAADIVVVGRFAADGNTALAAVGSTGSLINLIVNLLIGLSVGASVVVSRSFGARNAAAVDRAVHTAITVAAVGGVIVGIFGFCFASTFLSWMDTPQSVLAPASLYVRIYFCGLPAMMLYNFGSSILRAVGDTRRPLVYLSIAGVVNVVLNLIFVIVLHIDAAGVALATVISQCVSAFLVIRCLIVDGGTVKLNLRHLGIHRGELAQIVRIGLPAGIQGSLFSISNVLIQSSVNSFGEIVMAGNAAAGNIEGFIYTAMNAFYQATLNFTGQNVGAGKMDRVRRVALLSTGMVTLVGGVLGSAAYLFGEQLLAIYRPGETEVIAAGMIRLSYVGIPYFLCGIMEVLVGSLRGLGRSIMPMIVSLLGACGLRIVWIYTIFAASHTIETLYISYPISWIATSAVHGVCLLVTYRSVKRRLEAGSVLM